ncbi:hypothetical protein TNCV_4651121 [Trichonephila clavipes]|nr:hypothetical protein TNCV_4651121 [Trichonephila clavipes]
MIGGVSLGVIIVTRPWFKIVRPIAQSPRVAEKFAPILTHSFDQEAAEAGCSSKSEDSINEMLDDAALVGNQLKTDYLDCVENVLRCDSIEQVELQDEYPWNIFRPSRPTFIWKMWLTRTIVEFELVQTHINSDTFHETFRMEWFGDSFFSEKAQRNRA